MHYWHAVYFLFATKAEKGTTWPMVVTSSPELEALTGLAKRQVTKERSQGWKLSKPYAIQEDEADGGFALIAPGYQQLVNVHSATGHRDKIYLIPNGLVKNGWLSFIWEYGNSRLCIAIVNQLLRQPAGQRLLDFPHLITACKDPDRKTKPSREQMLTALDFLLEVDLVRPVEIRGHSWYQLQTHRFDSPARYPQKISTVEEVLPPFVQISYQKYPERTQRTIDCARAGRFDLEDNFEQIFRDIGYLNWEQESEVFLRRLSRWAITSHSSNEWRIFWKRYCEVRNAKDLKRFVSHREIIDLSQVLGQSFPLNVPRLNVKKLMHARLLIWLSLPSYLEQIEAICSFKITTDEHKKLWESYLSGGIPHLKRDLTGNYKIGYEHYLCQIMTEQSWPDTNISVQIEAVIYKRKKS